VPARKKALKDHGAEKVIAYCTHPVVCQAKPLKTLQFRADELVVTDTIP